MGAKQLKVGDASEEKVAESFKGNGYWVYVLPKKIGGQPFDIIACKGNNTWFIDAKHLEENKVSFSFERIEPNQKTAMMYAYNFAKIQNIGFCIVWDRYPDKRFFLPYLQYREMERNGNKSVKVELLSEIVY